MEILVLQRSYVRYGHSWDKIYLEILVIFFWINPFFRLIRKELEIQHEYAADSLSIHKGENELAEVILHSMFPENTNSLVSGFSQSSIKKRIYMISKTTPPKYVILRKTICLLLIPVLFILACNREHTFVPYADVAVKPVFQGGDPNSFALWVNKHVRYPEEAMKNNVKGIVICQFEIDIKGNIENVSILKSAGKVLDDEAIRVLSMSPTWTPGKNNEGKEVNVSYKFPIHFDLQ